MEGKLLQKLVRTILVSGSAFALSYVITLILTSYITNHIGAEAYGYITLARTCTQYAMIATSALNAFAARYIGVAYHGGDLKKANTYYTSVFWGNLLLATLILAAAAAGTVLLDRLIVITDGLVPDVKLLFALVFVSFWINTAFSVFAASAHVSNRLDVAGIWKGLSYVAEGLLLLLLFRLFPDRLWFVGVGYIAASAVLAYSGLRINRRHIPELQVIPGGFSSRAVGTLVLNGLWDAFNQLGNMLNSGLDLFVCNLLLSPAAMGQVAIVKTMDNLFHALHQLVSQAFQPLFLKSYSSGNRDLLLGQLRLAMKVSGMIAAIIFAGFHALGRLYYHLWIPAQDTELIYRMTMITILAGVVNGAMYPLYYIYTLTVKVRFPCMVTVIGGICNVAAMILGIRYFHADVSIVVWTTTVVMLFINLVTNPLYMTRCLQLSPTAFYPDLLRCIASCVVLVFLFQGIAGFLAPAAWLGLIGCALLDTAIGVPLFMLLTCRKSDWQLLAHMAGRV